MIPAILGWMLFGIAAIAVIIICSPLRAVVSGAYKAGTFSGIATLSFISPAIVSLDITLGTRALIVKLFGRTFGKRETAPPAPPFEAFDKEFTQKIQPAPSASRTHKIVPPLPNPDRTEIPAQKQLHPDNNATEVPQNGTPYSAEPPSSGTALPPPVTEPLDKTVPKRDNWLERLKYNKYFYFIRNNSWRGTMIRLVIRFLKSLFFMIRFDNAHLHLRAGIPDPMLLGTISGYGNAITTLFCKNRRAPAFRFEPVFMTRTLEVDAAFRISTSIATLLTPVMIILCTFPYLHTLLLWFRYRRIIKQRLSPAAA